MLNQYLSGERPRKCEGQVTIKGVEFTYPTRPDIKILKGLTVSVEPGQTLALVGQSGCGKSTLIQLLERFYDSDEGRILIDGKKERFSNSTPLERYNAVLTTSWFSFFKSDER